MSIQQTLCRLLIPALLAFLPGCSMLSTGFTIISGSENRSLEPILHEFGRKNFIDITDRNGRPCGRPFF